MVLSGALASTPFTGLPLRALYYALLEWARAAELTADRASALGTGDPLLTCRTLMRMAGGPVPGLDLDAFIRQATEYEGEDDPFARYSRFWREIGSTHPFPVRRVRELVAWVASGEFDRQRSGGYLRRGQEPPPSAEFDAALKHYRQRFAKIVERVGGGVQQVVSRFATWLDVDGDKGDDDGEAARRARERAQVKNERGRASNISADKARDSTSTRSSSPWNMERNWLKLSRLENMAKP